MIYSRPDISLPIDQGDIVEECPTVEIDHDANTSGGTPKVTVVHKRVMVLTQTCDLTHDKAKHAVVARVYEAQFLVDQGVLKQADVRGPVRAGRVFGWYFLPSSRSLGLPESIVDLRSLHTVSLDLLAELCRAGKRIAHLESLYREHLAQHFAQTYSRIGLPMPYETD